MFFLKIVQLTARIVTVKMLTVAGELDDSFVRCLTLFELKQWPEWDGGMFVKVKEVWTLKEAFVLLREVQPLCFNQKNLAGNPVEFETGVSPNMSWGCRYCFISFKSILILLLSCNLFCSPCWCEMKFWIRFWERGTVEISCCFQ